MPQGFPPTIPGVTEGQESDQPNPLQMMAKMMSAKPQQGAQLVAEAIGILRRAGQVDPRLEKMTGAAIGLLMQGPRGEGDREDGGIQEPMGGPSPPPGSMIPVRSP